MQKQRLELVEGHPAWSESAITSAIDRRVILKMSPPGGPALSEVRWLKQFKNIVPNIIAVAEASDAFVMERCSPGVSLKAIQDGSNDDTVTQILCEVIQRLQAQAPQDSSFKHLSELIPDLQSLAGRADPYLFQKSVSLFEDLTKDRSNDILLHGDLHHDNIISHGQSWKVIDPHGYMGDPVSEVGVMIYNPIDAFPKDKPLVDLIDRRLRIMGEKLNFDLKRVQAWAFCKTMLSSAWNIADFGEKATDQLEIAQAIHNLQL